MANFDGSRQIDLSSALNTNFKVFIDQLPTVTFFATGVPLPEVQNTPTPVDAPMQDWNLPGNKITWSPIEIGFIVDEGWFAYEEVFAWMNGTVLPNSTELSSSKYSDMIVSILDNMKNEIIQVQFVDCFPIQLGSVRLTSIEEAATLYSTVNLQYTNAKMTRTSDLARPVPLPLTPIKL